MLQKNVRSHARPRYSATEYANFKGVDFYTEASKVAPARSPDALNVAPSEGGIGKRVGWRVCARFDGRVNGMYEYLPGVYIVHAGDSLYKWRNGEAPEALAVGGLNDGRSMGTMYDGGLYLLTGAEYMRCDGEGAVPVRDIAHVPYTTVGGHDDGSSPNNHLTAVSGNKLNAANLLTPKRINSFFIRNWTGTNGNNYGDNELMLDGVAASVEKVMINGSEYAAANYTIKYYNRDGAGNLHEVSDADSANMSALRAASGCFPDTFGAPDLEVTFVNARYEDITGAIDKCTIISSYANRLFLSGNPDTPGRDFASGLNDPTYLPDTGYTTIGHDGAAIMGYIRMGEQQLIVKNENVQGASVYIRSYNLTDEAAVFPIKQGAEANGAISKWCFCNLVDDPLFLGRRSVYAVASQQITAEKTVQARSHKINPRLTLEPNLSEAVAAEWNDYYILCVNGNAYVADSRQKSYTENSNIDFEYEWYFWNNIPARVLFSTRDLLFFGTEDGEICLFNSDLFTGTDVYHPDTYADGYELGAAEKAPAAIDAWWSTPKADDGSVFEWKTLDANGSGIHMKTHPGSTVDITVLTDKDFGKLLPVVNAGTFDFNYLDFGSLNFNTFPELIRPFRHLSPLYKVIQVIIRNNRIYENMTVISITRRFKHNGAVFR